LNKRFYPCIPPKRRKEIEVLVLCARGRLDDESIVQIRSLVDETVDWEYLIKTACAHNVHFLLYRSLKKACAESVPNEALKTLEREYDINSRRSLLVFGKLVSILKLLQDNHILAVPFKGPVLAEMVYGDIALRRFGDLDILVNKHHAFKAIRILEDYGFRPEINLNKKQIFAYAGKKSSIELTGNMSGLAVDMHWEMSGSYTFYPMDLSRMETHLIKVNIAGKTINQPCAEDLLIYLCLNGARDCWQDMESVSALAGLIQSHPEPDGMRLMQLSSTLRCQRSVGLGLFLACDIFHVSLPKYMMTLVEKDPVIPELAETVYNSFFNENNGTDAAKVNSKFSAFHFRVRDRWSEKIRYGKYLLLGATAREWENFPVPAKLCFVHSILRPARLFLNFLARRFRVHGLKN